MNNKEIRWQQRFENLKKAYAILEKAISIENPSEIELGGIIQFYEMTFELSWKTLKDFLESEGVVAKTPREVIKQAFQAEIISEGHRWIDALDDRNFTTHIYDEETIKHIVAKIKTSYFSLLKNLLEELKKHESK